MSEWSYWSNRWRDGLFFLQAEDGIRYGHGTGVQTCALPISREAGPLPATAEGRTEAPVTVTVRKARPGDFEAVAGLLEELNRPKVLGTPDEDLHRQRYLAWLEGPDRFGFVAEIGGE